VKLKDVMHINQKFTRRVVVYNVQFLVGLSLTSRGLWSNSSLRECSFFVHICLFHRFSSKWRENEREMKQWPKLWPHICIEENPCTLKEAMD